MRRVFIACVASAFVVCPVTVASAQSPTDNYINSLRALGYERIEVSRTFLGRTRIVAERRGIQREIVMAPNGQVLFDFVDTMSPTAVPSTPDPAGSE